tara:strand:- start:79 stop:243 length:165 start_codon:yes stop_codon:yes gene_type:complete
MAKKKESKSKPTLEHKVDTIYEILSQHKVDIEYLNGKIKELSTVVDKVKGRMGI